MFQEVAVPDGDARTDRARGTIRRVSHHRGEPHSSHRSQGGVAIVELALILFPLTMIVLGAIDLGVRASDSNRLRAAAREGAAVAQYTPHRVDCGGDSNSIRARVLAHHPDLASDTNLQIRVTAANGSTLTGCAPPAGPNPAPPGTNVTIEVSTTQRPLSMLSRAFLDDRVVARIVVVVQG